jgi:hypothetical protein
MIFTDMRHRRGVKDYASKIGWVDVVAKRGNALMAQSPNLACLFHLITTIRQDAEKVDSRKNAIVASIALILPEN